MSQAAIFDARDARYLPRLLLAAVLLAMVAILGTMLQRVLGYAPLWPATALGIGLMWRHGLQYWPAPFIANITNAVWAGVPKWYLVLGSASLELLIAAIACGLLLRFGIRRSLQGVNQLAAFTAIAGVASLPVLVVFPAVMVLEFGQEPSAMLLRGLTYWMASAFCIVIFTPLVVTARYLERLSRRRLLRLVALLAGTVLCGTGAILFTHYTGQHVLFLLLPFMVACSAVAGVGGAAVAAFVMIISMVLTEDMVDPEPFAVQVRQLFAVCVVVTGYLLGASWAERKHISRELERRARFDALTGLMNRFEFERRLQQALDDQGDRQHALMYLDLDQFKLLNDTCGHMAGDEVLRELGEALAAALPPNASLARLGGDEFGCLVTDCGEETARDIADVLRETIRDYRYSAGDLQFSLGVSIGLTWFASASGDTVDSVLGRADVACYAAKEEGRNRMHAYHPRDEEMLKRHLEIREVSQLQAALDSGRFELHAQRIHDLADSDDKHFFEVLLRLRVDGQEISAASFLPVAHRYGMISVIDRWVLNRAASVLGGSDDEKLCFSVNISGATLDSAGIVEFISALPERYGFHPSRLCLEVTESVAINHLTRAVRGMRELRAQGFGIALDDFGAGVASFGYLRELPVSMVKLDGRFVRDLGNDPAAAIVIDALVRVAALRGIQCVAEWVESEQALMQLRKLGVRYAQGHLIHRPEPLANIVGSRAQPLAAASPR